MTLSYPRSLECPACGAAHELEVHQSITGSKYPERVDALLAGKVNQVACKCGKRLVLDVPLLVSLFDLGVLIQYQPAAEPLEPGFEESLRQQVSASLRVRLVRTSNELREKVIIARAKLNDLVVEMVKLLVRASAPPELAEAAIFFERERGATDLGFTLVAPDGSIHQATVPRRVYGNVAAKHQADIEANDAALVVDQALAKRLLLPAPH